MDVHDLHPPDDYSHRFFIWHEWLQANGPLTTENAFEYFTTSMFYDKQSNNQVLRMQTIHTGLPLLNEAEELKRFTGIEFALVHAQPPSLFIIHKRERLSPDEVRPLAAYFIMNGRIYQSPDVYTVLSNRLLTSLYSLQSTLDTLRSHRPDYTPRTGFVWPVIDSSLSQEAKKKDEGDREMSEDTVLAAKATNEPPSQKRQQNYMLLFNAMRATAAHSSTTFSSKFAQNLEELETEMPTAPPTSASAASATRKSATPAPTSAIRGQSKGPSNDTGAPEAHVKGVPGAGKKKKKRTLMASTPANS